MSTPAVPCASPAARARALDVLLSADLEPIVDMVAWTPEPNHFEIASAEGSVHFHREGDGFVVDWVHGDNPVANQDPTRFGSLGEEADGSHPRRCDNSYPLAYEQFGQLFDHPSAPDLCVIHAASHNWQEQGGHLGEHGSLGVVQARAPFIAAGAGVRRLGLVPGWCRLVDVAPTILALLGCPPGEDGDALRGQDGAVVTGVIDDGAETARQVVGLLFDGANANVLYDLAARGGAPNVARLIADGAAYRSGAIASLPTVTLANHTAILTGRHPGHHGILHNAWVDRRSGSQVVTNSPATWPTAMEFLGRDVDTVHTALKRHRKGVTTASINEPCDTGADFSTFDLIRRGESPARPPAAHELPDATERFVRPSKDYRWSSRVDHTAVEQFCAVWNGSLDRRSSGVPAFTWVNFTLTDAAFHEGGPYSDIAVAAVADTDARLGRILDEVEASGRWDETAFVLVADHGMEETDPAVRGDWDVALGASGVRVRDEGYGFLYLMD